MERHLDPQPSTDFIVEVVQQAGYQIVDQVRRPPREPAFLPPPSRLHPAVLGRLTKQHPAGLYKHQALSIEAALDGQDLCVATSTASGKSLIFMSHAAHLLLDDGSATVLALYPARALIQDQVNKWTALLKPLGIKHGYIDGGVPVDSRERILGESRILLMTPDVAHAWLMSNLSESTVAGFLRRLKLLVLDEAHVYDGVFGTNMAYFLRRFGAAARTHQVICSTATVGEPEEFFRLLTGRTLRVFGPNEDYSRDSAKTIFLAREMQGKPLESKANLLSRLANADSGRFIAFGDSRRMVEQLVAIVHREPGQPDNDEDVDPDAAGDDDLPRDDFGVTHRILPYRSGYESQDRAEIQRALSEGRLGGVVSTSALELGIDIGDLDTTVLLTAPRSAKALRQRLGRAGRRSAAAAILIDDEGVVRGKGGGLKAYLQRPVEPGWLYLDNRYIQYSQALCAAAELQQTTSGDCDARGFTTLPPSFLGFLNNELDPKEFLPPDLYPLKQRAQSSPHHEFPLRSSTEQEFLVKDKMGRDLGTLTLSQALREAYAGAIYYYMARPYRVYQFHYRTGEIKVQRERRWTTRPVSQTMVFPQFQGVRCSSMTNGSDFVAEAQMQVSERVVGFVESKGGNKIEHRYGPSSPFSQKPLSRFFETTGVCWYSTQPRFVSEGVARLITDAFCSKYAVGARDLGIGTFVARESPIRPGRCQGICVFDATNGSLRLTQRLAENFLAVLEAATSQAAQQERDEDRVLLEEFAELVRGMRAMAPGKERQSAADDDSNDEWVEVIAAGQKAIYLTEDGPTEVTIIGHRHTPKGLVYDLEPITPGSRWWVGEKFLQPLHGQTSTVLANLYTGEIR